MLKAIDFANSYKTRTSIPDPNDKRVPGHKPWGNTARIMLDARCALTDEATGQADEFFLIVPCRSEWVYQEENLFQMPNREYREIWSRTRHVALDMSMTYDGEGRSSEPVGERFTFLQFTVREFLEVTLLETDADVVEATLRNLPLVGQTEIWDEEGKACALLEYPIKTINTNRQRGRFQVDTGPLILPDWASQAEQWIDRLVLAHVAYNTFDRAEFIVRRPTPIVREGREVAKVLHYSEIVVCQARHRILCGGRL